MTIGEIRSMIHETVIGDPYGDLHKQLDDRLNELEIELRAQVAEYAKSLFLGRRVKVRGDERQGKMGQWVEDIEVAQEDYEDLSIIATLGDGSKHSIWNIEVIR